MGNKIYTYVIQTNLSMEFTNTNVDSGRLQTQMVMYDFLV